MNPHGVVEVSDDTRRLARRRAPETRVVGIAEDPLQPGQRAGRRHCLVGEVACRQTGMSVYKVKAFTYQPTALLLGLMGHGGFDCTHFISYLYQFLL